MTNDPPSPIHAFLDEGIAILSDDQAPSQHAALIAPAQDMAPELLNRLLHLSRGNVHVVISPERAQSLMIPPMVEVRPGLPNESPHKALMSVEAREGVTTGISTADRARTVLLLGEPHPQPRALVRPGHVFPIEARRGGVLVRNALPEGALDLITLMGRSDAALYMELFNDRGEFLSLDGQQALAIETGYPIIPLSSVVQYRLEHETFVERVAESLLPTREAGVMRSILYRSRYLDGEHLALVKGDAFSSAPVLTRVQPENTFADVFGGPTPPSRNHIRSALQKIGAAGAGVFLYLRRPAQGQLARQIHGQLHQQQTSPALMKEYGIGAQILRDLGVQQIALLTNSPKNLVGLKPFGIEIVTQHALSD